MLIYIGVGLWVVAAIMLARWAAAAMKQSELEKRDELDSAFAIPAVGESAADALGGADRPPGTLAHVHR